MCGAFAAPADAKIVKPKPVGSRLRSVPDRRATSSLSYYLALGDSVPVWNGTSSYPYLILRRYQRKLPGLRLNDLAVSGSMLDAGQYRQALGFLDTHRRHIALITIDIGGNDVVGCGTRTGIDYTCFNGARVTIRRNLTAMLAGLHAAAPGVPVIGMSYYDPFLGYRLAGGPYRSFALSTLPLLRTLNRELTSLYGGPTKRADVQGAFRSTDFKTAVASPWGKVPVAVARACSWLDIQCLAGAPDVFGDDPNHAGAAAIASAFERTINARHLI